MFQSKAQAYLGILFGLGLIAFGVYKYIETEGFFKKAKETTSIVSNINTKYSKGDDDKYTIFYDYVVNGKTYTESEQSSTLSVREGESYAIYYDPENPDDARFKTEASMVPWIAMGLGAVVFGMALFYLFKKPSGKK